MQNLSSTLILTGICAIWFIIFYLIMRVSLLGLRSKNWPVTDGEVIVSKSEKLTPVETGMIINRYRAVILYKYTVNEFSYTSDVVSCSELAFHIFNRGLRGSKGVEHLTIKYPLGSKVTVYYDPNYPARSVLEPGAFDFNLILIITILSTVGFLFFAILLTLV